MSNKNKIVSSAAQEKKKRKIDPIVLVFIIVVAVLLIAFIGYVGYTKGWWLTGKSGSDGAETEETEAETTEEITEGSITMDDWSVIRISASDIEVTDDDVEYGIETFLTYFGEETEETEGTVEDGDTLTITYNAYFSINGEKGELLDGGSAEDAELTIGSGDYIEGFEDGLIGEKIGSTVELFLTFPDDYSETSLQGVSVIFEVEITNRIVTVLPDLTDEFVSENSYAYWGEQIDTVEELEEWVYESTSTYMLQVAILTNVLDLMTVESYDVDDYELMYESTYELLEEYAEQYSTDADTMAQIYGYDDADSYCMNNAKYYCELIMLLDYFWDEFGFEEFTDEEIEESIYEYMTYYGYEESYTVDEFIELFGEAWYLTYVNVEMKEDPVLEALEEYVEIVEDDEEE